MEVQHEAASLPLYATIDSFAEMLIVSRTTVKRWLKLGLPSVCVGRSRRIQIAQAHAWLLAGGAEERPKKAKIPRVRRTTPGLSGNHSDG